MRKVTFAATQFACGWDRRANIDKARTLVREAAGEGAQVVLLQELFETPYFCQDQTPKHFALAAPFEGNPLIGEMSTLAAELKVVLPVSFFERAGHALKSAGARSRAIGVSGDGGRCDRKIGMMSGWDRRAPCRTGARLRVLHRLDTKRAAPHDFAWPTISRTSPLRRHRRS